MRPVYVILAVVIVLGAIGYTVAVEEKQALPLRMALNLSEHEDCGVEKLTEDELANLVTVIASRRGMSYLDESARNFLRHDGWAVAEVIGYGPDRSTASSSDDIVMIVERLGKLYAMEPPMGEDVWPTGLYWTKATFISTWSVMSPEGEVEHCGIDELN